ncbi:DNA-3-methyladenine glycosylase [Litorihabitans aurantiacus]|uniref:Putative 3-methyladenine DNA glycosylase n=1 Tax=Litorihabitans aurantiacus TaxID=1930061 RepID=A0AA37XEC0_9MICO|nr:DNA-3-methyladenine glycosylase [Litorihabitans aurantiacus]GMA31657.1 putative 3-methyladenine DNA glycosylase [Litorihabitans aurantiacus]
MRERSAAVLEGAQGAPRVAPDAAWFTRSPQEVALGLLDAHVRAKSADGAVTVRLSEVEAYGGADDPGSHAFRGRTARNAAMFGPPGHVYVYFTYGMHWCANLVTGPDGEASAVLLRAGEVVEGVELARTRRPTSRTDRDLASGPARLANALGIRGGHDGADALDPGGAVSLRVREVPAGGVAGGPRTGVSGDGGLARYPWRYRLEGDPTVSRYRAA